MLKKSILMSGMVCLALAVATPASAAGWGGPYAGLNAGYGWSTADTDVIPLPSAAAFGSLMPTTMKPKPAGGLGGGQVGFNWQNGNWVFGLEADVDGSGMSKTAIVSPFLDNNGATWNGTLTVQQKIDAFGTLRGRVGTDVGNSWLLYGTGGLAWGNVKTTANADFRPQGTIQYPLSTSKTKWGWTAGAGVEWAGGPANYSFRLEYLYYDLGSQSAVANPVPANPPFQVQYNWKVKGNILRAGVNYFF